MENISSKFTQIMEKEDPNESLKELLDLEKDHLLNVEIKQLKSMCYRKIGNNSKALEQLLEALELQPLNHKINFNLGQLYKAFKKHDQAMAYYKNSVTFNPEFLQGINTLGDIFFNKKDFHQAIAYYTKSVTLSKNKDNIFSVFRLALCFFEKSNTNNNIEEKRNAVKYFEMAREIDPEESSIQKNLIGIYNLYGMKNKAIKLSREIDGVFDIDNVKKEVEINYR